ncbi:MAG: hypothetical protein CMG19_04235 [Candidatus Marinimicrobia bacterium]|nr:hypothetical protein [Candidatus Neomarinimicrobiota bacterium]
MFLILFASIISELLELLNFSFIVLDFQEKVKLSIDLFDDCFVRWSDSHRKHSLILLSMVKSNIQKEEDALNKMERILGK